ncbi:MAG: hypothetical protein RL380_304 [Verrucomicrobiota bacterium]|jgi:16S rRNA C1402 (ribose-2'-O) methylase RsmI
MNESNETLETLKAIHAEQQKQTKYLQNIYQIQVVFFAIALLAFVVGFAFGPNALRIR